MALESIDFGELKIADGPAIGEGGFAKVSKATFRGQTVAVKVWLDTTQEHMTKLRELFIREVDCARRVNHPNVVRMLAACGKPLAIVMEYVDGSDLFRLMHSKSVYSWGHVQEMSMQMAAGMAHVHAQDIVHRDVKSCNFLVSRDGTVKVCDFGLGRITDMASQLLTRGRGSTRWISPEALETSSYGKAADVYSFGVVLWEMVTRRMPYEEKADDVKVIQAIQSRETPVIPSTVPPQLAHAIRQCWLPAEKRPTFEQLLQLLSAEDLIPIEVDADPVEHPADRKSVV